MCVYVPSTIIAIVFTVGIIIIAIITDNVATEETPHCHPAWPYCKALPSNQIVPTILIIIITNLIIIATHYTKPSKLQFRITLDL